MGGPSSLRGIFQRIEPRSPLRLPGRGAIPRALNLTVTEAARKGAASFDRIGRWMLGIKGAPFTPTEKRPDQTQKNPAVPDEVDPIVQLMRIDGLFIRELHESYRKDKGVALEAVQQNHMAFQFIDPSLRSDREFVLEAVKLNGLALKFADETLKRDRTLVLEAIKQNDDAFCFADASLRKDRSFVIEAVGQNFWVLTQAFNVFQENHEIIREVTDQECPYSFTVRASKGLIAEVAKKHPFSALQLATPSRKPNRKLAWSIDPRLAKLDIEFIRRFKNREVMEEIILNREKIDKPDGRPLAVLIFAKSDYNGAFEINKIEELIRKGYRVVYFEASTTKQFLKCLKSATYSQKADLLMIAGHGEKDCIELNCSKNQFIRISDEKGMSRKSISKSLAEDSVIILMSCSTGQGRELEDNMANMMKRIFPVSRVLAPVAPTFDQVITFLGSKVAFVTFDKTIGMCYRIDNRKS